MNVPSRSKGSQSIVHIGLRSWVSVLLVLSGLVAVGCVSQAQQARVPLRVGIVNLDRILPELPEYRQYSDAYEAERTRLYQGLQTDQNGNAKVDEQKKQEIEQANQKWDDTKRKFLEKVSDQIRLASNQVARDKQIDIVLVNAPWLPVNQRLAVDITTDVIYVLRDRGKSVH